MNDIIVKLGKVSEQYPSFISIQPIVFTEMNFEPVPLMRDTSSFNRSTIVIDNMLLHFGKQDFIAQNMPNNAIPNLNTCNRSYSASLKQREFLCRSILKSPIHQVVLNGKDIPKKIHHEFLRCFLPLAGFDRNLVSSIQIVGVTDNLLIVHKSFTVIAILTVVNCVRLCYLSIRKGQCLLLCWLSRESGRTPLEFEALL